MRDGLALKCAKNRIDMGLIIRPWINHSNLASAKNVRSGTMKCERPGVIRYNAPDAGSNGGHLAVFEL